MHATHQFFLTKRSLYLLVLDARLTQEENRVEYWLKIIQSFGGESPVLIVGNKGDVIGAAAGREFKELFRVKLEDEFQASPAFADGKMILRGSKNVWCFGKTK